MRLELDSGSRIMALPGGTGGETVRGFSAVRLLIEDESARTSDDVHASARPMLDPTHGRVLLLSTPYGARGHFYEASRDPSWQAFEVPAERIPRLSPTFLREQERALGSWWFDQEYRCHFLDAATAAFAVENIEAAFTTEVHPWKVLSSSAWM